MSDPIQIEGEHGVTVELHENGDTIEVYCASSYVGEIGPDTLYSVADRARVVIPDRVMDTEG